MAVVAMLGEAAAQPSDWRMDRMALHESLRFLPPNIRSYYLERAGMSFWPDVVPPSVSAGLVLVGKWGAGPSAKVTGRDSVVYLSRGSEVAVISFADTANPRILANIQAPGLVARSVLVGDRLYVSSGYIETYDVSDPATPVRLGSAPIRAPGIDVKDTLVYTVYRDSFKVFSFADPASPRLLGACRDSGYDISVNNGYAYVADRWGLYVIDVRDPAAPRRVASWGSNVLCVSARTSICCATTADANDNLTFHVLNTAQPASIAPLGALANHGGHDIFLEDSLVYVSGYYTGSGCEFQVLSIGDSTRPRLVGDASTPGDNSGVWARSSTRRAFVADRIEGLQVLDLSDRANPVVDTSMLAAGQALDVSVTGNIVCVAEDVAGLRILDVADPTRPTEVSGLDTTGQWELTAAVAARDSFLFMPWTPNPTRLRSVDIGDPRNPTIAASVSGSLGTPQALALADSFLYTAGVRRFQVVNVARPREPRLVGTCVTQDGTRFGLDVRDTSAYLISGSVQIINIARPTNPVVVGSIGAFGSGISVRDTFAYVPYGYDTLRVYSVAVPQSPRLLGFAPLGTHTSDVALAESTAAVSTFDGLELFSLRNPAQPTWLGSVTTPYGPRRVVYSRPYFYTAMYDAGVAIYATETVGIRDAASAESARPTFAVRPNPSSGTLEICSAPGVAAQMAVRVLDVAGREVLTQKLHGSQALFGIGWLPGGVYVLEVTAAGYSRRVKIVKQ